VDAKLNKNKIIKNNRIENYTPVSLSLFGGTK